MTKKSKAKKASSKVGWRASDLLKHIPVEVMEAIVKEHLKARGKLSQYAEITEIFYGGQRLVIVSNQEMPTPTILTHEEFIRIFPEEA